MKKFTFKDFIAYNNPCFSCGNQIYFRIGFFDTESKIVSYLPKPAVTTNYTEIDLQIKWSNSLRLYVFHKTNKFLTNDNGGLTNYLNGHKLFLDSRCDRCGTYISSQHLNFNLEKAVIDAVKLSFERLVVKTDNKIYDLSSWFDKNKSDLIVENVDKVRPSPSLTMELPLLPKFKFKNRQMFLDKIKTYILFS